MAATPTIYCAAVIYNRQILCSCTAGSGQYEPTLEYVVPQVDTARCGDKMLFTTHDGLSVHILVAERGVLFACVATINFSKQRAHACLEALLKNFETANLFSRVVDAGPYGLMTAFSLALQVQMEKYSKPDALSSGQTALQDLQAKVEEVKVVMVRNVQKIIDRGDRLEDLNDRAESLEMRSDQFRITATRVRKKMWWQNMRMKLIMAGGVLLALFIIIMVILGTTGAFDSSNNKQQQQNQRSSSSSTTFSSSSSSSSSSTSTTTRNAAGNPPLIPTANSKI